jgi:hypothetical protein
MKKRGGILRKQNGHKSGHFHFSKLLTFYQGKISLNEGMTTITNFPNPHKNMCSKNQCCPSH